MSVCYRCGKHGDPMHCNCINSLQRHLDEATRHFRQGRPGHGEREVSQARIVLAELRKDARSPWEQREDG